MVEEKKDSAAAAGAGDEQVSGTGTPASATPDPKPAAPASTAAPAAAAQAEAQPAAPAAAASEAPAGDKPAAAPAATEEDQVAKAQADLKAAWEKQRQDGKLTLKDETLVAIEMYAKQNKLDDTQKALLIKNQDDTFRAQQKEWQDAQKQWISDLQADPIFGGKNFKTSVEGAKRVMAKFGPESFVKMLDTTGLGNHKDLVLTFARIDRALMANDRFVGMGDEQQKPEIKTQESVMFPNSQDPNVAAHS
jgi:flagellar motor protein MotB